MIIAFFIKNNYDCQYFIQSDEKSEDNKECFHLTVYLKLSID